MSSNIDPTKPETGFASTANVRANFAAAKAEIEALQAGVASGVDVTFESATTDTDQGDGKIWLNNATPASATVLYIDDVSAGGVDINAWADALDDSTTTGARGLLIVTLDNTPSQYQIFQITGAVTSASTYTKVPVSHVVGYVDNFADGDGVHVQFARTGDKGETGNTGATGPAGPTGPETGIPLTIDLASQTDADPGAGKLRYDNATIASVTTLFVDDEDSNGNDIQAQVNGWDDSTTTALRGQLKVVQDADPSNYHLFNITGANVDPGGYTKIAVAHVETGGTVADTDAIHIQFTRTGNQGAGDLLSTNNLSDVANAATAFGNIKQAASETATGVVELATDAETATGTDTARAVTPANIASLIGSVLQGADPDTLKADTADILTAGFAGTVHNAGTQSSGTYTPNEASGNLQRAVNGGAHTLAPPTNDCTIIVQYTNNASAGAITSSGFTKTDGDSFSTTNGDDFFCLIVKNNGFSSLTVKALQ